MNLFEEEILKPKKKKKINISAIIVVLIIILTILCVLAIVGISYLKGTILTVIVDGQSVSGIENMFVMEENNKVYIPIKRMAKFLEYEAYNGDFTTLSEDDITKCHIKSENETISFTLNSNVLEKQIDEQIQQVKITEPIKQINGELYISSDCTRDAFNFIFYYNNNRIIIQTLEYLYELSYKRAMNNGYAELEEENFENLSAVLDGMLIVKSEKGDYGVISTDGETEIIETKYDNIQYIRENSEFLVESNDKQGIITRNKKTKLEIIYDDIEKVESKDNIFYIVSENDLYGVLDENGKRILYSEYDQIGIDIEEYSQNLVANGYILRDNFIPLKSGEEWFLFSIEKGKILDFGYDSFGCPKGKNNLSRTYGVLEIPTYNLIVGCKENKYNLIDSEGKWLFEEFIFDSIYITVKEGKNNYYVSMGEEQKELEAFLQEKGIEKPTQLEQ